MRDAKVFRYSEGRVLIPKKPSDTAAARARRSQLSRVINEMPVGVAFYDDAGKLVGGNALWQKYHRLDTRDAASGTAYESHARTGATGGSRFILAFTRPISKGWMRTRDGPSSSAFSTSRPRTDLCIPISGGLGIWSSGTIRRSYISWRPTINMRSGGICNAPWCVARRRSSGCGVCPLRGADANLIEWLPP